MRDKRILIMTIWGALFLALILAVQTMVADTNAAQQVTKVATTLSLEPARDNTLYESESGALSNGAGAYFFAGNTAGSAGPVEARRGLLAFDIAGNVPSGATIISATLRLHVSKVPFLSEPERFALHKLTTDWGEGSSDAFGEEGGGALATDGDATWIHAVYSATTPANSILWGVPGGDFVPTASAEIVIDQLGHYTWGPTTQVIADVQSWLDNPASNFGWIVLGNEDEAATARRFDSRENIEQAHRPVLMISYLLLDEYRYLPLVANE